MPPCAYPVLLSRGSALVRMTTRPASAREIAARRPAMPLPITRKSPPMGTVLSYQCRTEEPDPPSPFGFGEARAPRSVTTLARDESPPAARSHRRPDRRSHVGDLDWRRP